MDCRHRNSITINTLRFPAGTLYGREDEVSTLNGIYKCVVDRVSASKDENPQERTQDERRTDSTKDIVIVPGYSGVGKTALIESLRKRVRKRGDLFITGKFDQLTRNRDNIPYSAIVDALSEIPELIDQKNGKQTLLHNKIDAKLSEVIVRCVPALWGMLFEGEPPSYEKWDRRSFVGSEESRNQFNFAFRSFLYSLCEEYDKIMVLFIDDLQWVDAASLELIDFLVTDTDNHRLLFIGSYRENEVDEIHPLSARFREMERSDAVAINEIHLGNLKQIHVNEIISNTLNMEVMATEPLAVVVHSKTMGNAFYVIEFLKALVDDELLKFNFGTFQWSWDLDGVQSKFVTSNVADLVLAKLKRMPVEQSQLLAVSSSLGSPFDLSMLTLVISYLQDVIKKDDRLSFLTLAPDVLQANIDQNLSEGLLEKASESRQDSFRFCHDKIQEAASAIIPEDRKGILQWHIGQGLISKLPKKELNQILFCVVYLLNSGIEDCKSSLTDDDKEMKQLAELNAAAGRKAMSVSAYRQAAAYFKTGLKCMQNVSGSLNLAWTQNYGFCSSTYQAYASCLCFSGDFDLMDGALNKIFKYATDKKSRLEAYSTLVNSHTSRNMIREAFDTAFLALAEIGGKLPVKPSKAAVFLELLKTKLFMKKYPIERLKELPELEDKSRMIMMRIFIRLMAYAYLEEPNFLPLLVFRLVKWSCIYGTCESSPPAFALYGLLVLGALGDFQLGHSYAEYAMDLLGRVNADEYSFTILIVGIVRSNLKPITSSIKDYFSGYQIGMSTGDTYYAINNVCNYLLTALFMGRPLHVVEGEMRMYFPHFAEYGQLSPYERGLPIWQFVINLMSKTTQPDCELSGELMDETAYLKQYECFDGQPTVVFVYKQILAYYLGNFDLAAELSNKIQGYAQKYSLGNIPGWRHTFFDGLTSIAMLRKHPRSGKWYRRKKKNMKRIRTWVKNGNPNLTHMILLLEAEEYTLKKKADLQVARSKFDSAISVSSRVGFSQDTALGCERAALFCKEKGDENWAMIYLARAHERWSEYGACSITKKLERDYPQIINEAVRRLSAQSSMQVQKQSKRNQKGKKTIIFSEVNCLS